MIWCQGGNPASSRIAISAGWWYGFRSDSNHYADEFGPVSLLDSHWEADRVDWPRHLAVAAEVRPWLATVPDTMSLAELGRTLSQAEEIARFAVPLIVPKCSGLVDLLPDAVGGKPIVLGYSVPTGYGGTEVPCWEFSGRPVHLLGGSARAQAELCGYLDVVSADGNTAWLLARRGIVIDAGTGLGGKTIRQEDGKKWAGKGAHLEALTRSMGRLRQFWSRRQSARKILWNDNRKSEQEEDDE